MNDWIQYHNPDVMEYGIDAIQGPPYSIVSDKAVFPCEGLRIWIVGRRAAIDSNIYLGGWMVVDEVVDSGNPQFLYEYLGQNGHDCNPMPPISDAAWYPALLKLTGNFRFGLTEIKNKTVSDGLKALAEGVRPRPRRRR
jgi:hypothetical protein